MELLADSYLLLCVLIAGGLTELIMRKSPEAVTKRKYAIVCTVVLSSLAVLTESLARGNPLSDVPFRILLVASLTTLAYGVIKSIVLGWIKK